MYPVAPNWWYVVRLRVSLLERPASGKVRKRDWKELKLGEYMDVVGGGWRWELYKKVKR